MSGTLVIGVIAPHGDLAIAEGCDDDTRGLAVATQRAMAAMAARVAGAVPDVAVVVTPHNIHVADHMAVLTASEVAGRLDEAANPVSVACRIDRELALAAAHGMN